MRTYYEVLGVDEDADTEAIQAAYRERVKQTHPDLSDDPNAGEQFQRVREAKEVLTDPDERARYDRLGHARYVGDGASERRDASTQGQAGEGEGRTNRTRANRTRTNRSQTGRDASDQTASGSAYKRRQRERRKWAEFWREHREWAEERARQQRADATDEHRESAGRDGDGRREPGGERQRRTGQRHRRERAASGGPDDPWWTRSERFTAATGGASARSWGAEGTWQQGGRANAGAGSAGRRRTDQRSGRRQDATTEQRAGYRVTRSSSGPQFTVGRLGLATVTFLLYPAFLASSVLPAFPLAVNVLVGACTLLLVAYLVSMPEVGVLVFGGWTVLTPMVFLVAGVGLISPGGFLLWTACWIPCLIALANFVFQSP